MTHSFSFFFFFFLSFFYIDIDGSAVIKKGLLRKKESQMTTTTTTMQFSMLEDTDDTLCHCECCFRCWHLGRRTNHLLYTRILFSFSDLFSDIPRLLISTIVETLCQNKMPADSSNFDLYRAQVRAPFHLYIIMLIFIQLATSLSAVAESMRDCAKIADMFAKIVHDPEYSPDVAETFHGITR